MEAAPVVRPLLIALLLVAPALAQSSCPPDCPPSELVPITGRVVGAVDGHPIAGATVRYSAEGTSQGAKSTEFGPLSGVLLTDNDGEYVLPKLPAGNVIVRVYTPGFLGDQQVLHELTKAELRAASALRQSFCITSADKPSCATPKTPDGLFRLYKDPLELRSMPDVSLAAFELPIRDNPTRRFLSATFSTDGNRLGFLTFDSVSLPGQANDRLPPFSRCVVWIYGLGSERMVGMYGVQPSVCEGANARMTWSSGDFYIVYRVGGAAAPEQVIQVSAEEATSQVYDSLPSAVQAALAVRGPQSMNERQGLEPQVTNDGQFAVRWLPEQGCGPLMVTFKRLNREQAMTMGCEDLSFMLDPANNLLFYNESLLTDNAGYNYGRITEVDLQTGQHRSFRVPVFKHAPQLLAWQPLGGGAVRMAYTMDGDCDGSASDYAEPGQPDAGRNPTPNRSSVCFITIPQLPSNAQAASAH